MTSRTPVDYDVLIIGGGMVGACLACALEDLPLRIGVVEELPVDAGGQPSYDDRPLALSLGSRRILETLGLWDRLKANVGSIREVHVSQKGRFGVTRFKASEEGISALGFVAVARDLGRVFWHELQRREGLTLLSPVGISGIYIDEDAVRVGLQGRDRREVVRSRLLVAADGARSAVRESLGLKVRERSYGECAISTNVTPVLDHNDTAYERFTNRGTIALLPMSERRYGLIWTATERQAMQLLDLDDQAFLATLEEQVGPRLGGFERVGFRSQYPLALVRCLEPIRHRVVVVGNAAHTLHPIAAQGFNLGLRDAAALAEVLADASRVGEDLGALEVLQRYGRWRQQDQQTITHFTDTLAKLFSARYRFLAGARSMGLLILDSTPWLKHRLARQAMGLAGRQTRLARGLSL